MKEVKFKTVQELALALLDKRIIATSEMSVLSFSESMGCFCITHAGRNGQRETGLREFMGVDLYELPTPRHHAELIKAWAEDESLILEWLLGEGDSYESWNYAPVSGDFYIGTSYRLIDRSGNVIMVSEAKK